MNLTDLPVDLFIKKLTYLPFKDAISVCRTNTRSLNYCTNPQYKHIWKLLIDNTFSYTFNYNDNLQKIWRHLNVDEGTYNYLVYANLVKLLDPITQLRIYYKQGDMESFDSKLFSDQQRFIAYYMLGNIEAAIEYLPDETYQPFIDSMKGNLDKKWLDMILLIMAENGSPLGVSMAVKQGANVNIMNSLPLRVASQRGNLGTVQSLVENGARVRLDDNIFINSALREASLNKHPEIVKYLKSKGA